MGMADRIPLLFHPYFWLGGSSHGRGVPGVTGVVEGIRIRKAARPIALRDNRQSINVM